MHCPNCGKPAKDQQKFCRACGFGLEPVAQLLSEQRTTGEAELTEAERRTEKLVGWGINALLGILIIGAAKAIIYWVMIVKGQFWPGIFLLGLLAWLALYMFLIGKWTELQKSSRRRSAPALPPAEDTAKLPATAPEPVPGITERTTDLLEVRPVRRSDELGT
ncbi:MAG: zinc ribbon domain-containing protein [Blastocatellia bacterium]